MKAHFIIIYLDHFRPAWLCLIFCCTLYQYQNKPEITVMHMSKNQNPEFSKYASDLARAQDAMRSANEELIKLSQRFGRMMPKLQRLDTPAILSWFNLYNKVKDAANKADDEISPLLSNEQVATNPLFQSQVGYYYSQRSRLCSKVEVIDDILSGMMEDLLENGSFQDSQKEEMRTALGRTLEKSCRQAEMPPALA